MRKIILTGLIAATALGGITACSDDDDIPTAPVSVTYISAMNGANERPNANASAATGTGTYVLTGNILTYALTATGLTTPATGSHLHIGGAAVAGPIIVGYVTANVTSGTITTGTIDLSKPIATASISISGDSLRVLLNNGNLYSNIHNSTFPGGEIRGQLIRRN